jgi:2-polyprenyl-6-methoxyphenol hydroxylase-like FAD-dependent oxidoreductase
MPPSGREPVIVGASVAGALTALRLGNAGIACAVFESRKLPWAKVCGEGFHPSGRRALEEVIGDVTTLGWQLRGFRFTTATAELIALDHPAPHVGLGCDRFLLEQRLWHDLTEHPLVTFEPGCSVHDIQKDADGWVVETPRGSLQASHVVAADGVRSRLRSISGRSRRRLAGRWGLRQRLALDTPSPDDVEVCFLDDGEVFVTPLGPRRVSIAVLGREDLVRRLRDPGELAVYLDRMRAGCGLANRLRGATPEGPSQIMPHRGQRAVHWCKDGLYLAGDAAAYLDPISGAGMTLAAVSARIIAASITDVLAGEVDDARAEASAERELRRSVRPFRNLTNFLLLLARYPWFRRTAIAVLRRSPRLVDRLAKPTLGTDVPPRLTGIETGTLPSMPAREQDREERA